MTEYIGRLGIKGDPIGDFAIGISAIGWTYPPEGPQTDIKVVWDVQNSRGDWQLSGPDLLRGDDLATACFVSFFSDGLAADDDEIPDGTTDRRGWWGDAGQDKPIGSKLWLLEREKLTLDVAQRAEGYGAESLQWLIDDGVIAGAAVTAQPIFGVPGKLFMKAELFKTDGSRKAVNFIWVWKGDGS